MASPSPSPSDNSKGWQTSFMARTLFANPALDGKSQGSFWSSLAKRAKAALLEDDDTSQRGMEYKHEPCEMQAGGKQPSETKAHTEHEHNQTVTTPTLQKGFHSFKSSLSALSGKIGNAIEGLAPVETKASDAICPDSPLVTIKKKVEGAKYIQQQGFKISYETITDYETQLKASRDVAMAMATKAKLLLRELKTIKADLAFAKNRCLQLEEENKRLRESLATGVRPVEEDLMRDQLETLLEEKCRLAQENAFYARENRFLREVVGYHQLTMQDVVLLDESITEAAELADESGFEDHDLDQLPEKVISIVST